MARTCCRPRPSAPGPWRGWIGWSGPSNHIAFPVTLTLTFPEPVAPDRLELVQSGWWSGDYLSKGFAVDLSATDDEWKEVAIGTLPATALAVVRVSLPGTPLKSLRVRLLSTHDTEAAMSCGLTRIRLWSGEQELLLTGVKAEASSSYPGHPAENVLAGEVESDQGAFSLAALQRLRQRLDDLDPPLDLWVVLYTGELAWEAVVRPHLELCDVVTMWTWTSDELAHLEENFARFEALVGEKRKVLGLYLWDYGAKKPMPLPDMEKQCELGLRWLREGRIEGMIFLASCICDLNLEAVEWTRRWIVARGGEGL